MYWYSAMSSSDAVEYLSMMNIHQYYPFPTFDGLLIYLRTISHNLSSSEHLDKILGRLSLCRGIT